MRRKGVLKAGSGPLPKWCHFSQQDNTVKLRFFGPNYIGPEILNLSQKADRERFETLTGNSDEFSVQEIAALTEDVLPFSADKIKADTTSGAESWAKVFERLDELRDVRPTGAKRQAKRRHSKPKVAGEVSSLIPQTRIRRFYETLRMFSEASVAQGMADHLVGASGKRIKKLEVIVEESIRHFSRYSNIDEFFQDRNNPDWFEKYADQPSAFAKCLVARMRPVEDHCHPVEGKGMAVQVKAVDYEISPFRTTRNARFENGVESASGGGGIDLLLKDCSTGVPIVGEIKADTDRDLFLAMIQALTYTVELATEPQVERIKRAYPEFSDLGNKCRFDIFLICEAGQEHGLTTQTKSLVKCLLNNPEGPVAQIVRRVCIVEASLDGEREVSLTNTFSYPNKNPLLEENRT